MKRKYARQDLNRHLECTDVSFNPENGAFSKINKTLGRARDPRANGALTD